MTETPSDQTPETILVEFANAELGFSETPEMMELREKIVTAETDDRYIERLTNYQDAAWTEIDKQDKQSRPKVLIGLRVSAGIKHTRGGKEQMVKEALEDAFYAATYDSRIGSQDMIKIQNIIGQIDPSINSQTFNLEQYYSSRSSF